MVDELSSRLQDKKIWFKELNIILDKQNDFGCQKHLNEFGHKKIAEVLEPIIRKVMNW